MYPINPALIQDSEKAPRGSEHPVQNHKCYVTKFDVTEIDKKTSIDLCGYWGNKPFVAVVKHSMPHGYLSY